MKQLFLIYSSDASWVTQRREDLVGKFVPKDMRDENLREFYSSTASPVNLDDILADILGEMATIPFLPDSRRVVVVHNLKELYGGSKKPAAAKKGKGKKNDAAAGASQKLTSAEILAAFIERDLPATDNVLIFTNIIEYDRNQEVDVNGSLFKLIQNAGDVMAPTVKEQNPIWAMSDSLMERNTVNCLRHFRSLYRDDNRSRLFHEMLRNIRYMIQANILSKMEAKGTSRELIEMKYLPNDKKLNFYQQAPFVQQKIRRNSANFTLRELMKAMDQLLEINNHIFPSKNVLYVPDMKLMMEAFIIDFCEGGNGPRRKAQY